MAAVEAGGSSVVAPVVAGIVGVGSDDVFVPAGGGGAIVPVPPGTGGPVAAVVFVAEPLSVVARIAIAAASAATMRAPRTGQIQSPGYQGIRRRHAVDSTGMSPPETGRRRPHSRQYSWNGSYGVPQRGHSPPSAPIGGGGGGCSSGGSGGRPKS